MTVDLAEIEREIESVVNHSARDRADVAGRLNATLKADKRPEAIRLRACVLTCLLDIPNGGPMNIPICQKHPR